VVAVGRQVIVHAPYTVSLPPTFGELFYARGGRVDGELNHAHEPLVTQIEVWLPLEAGAATPVVAVDALLTALTSSDAVKAALDPSADGPPARAPVPLRWTRGDEHGFPRLTIGAVFHDLVAGVHAVRAILATHDIHGYTVRVFECLDRSSPLAHLAEDAATGS
jgi:hypothetical protein